MHERHKIEGIVCHALPFQDNDIILTVFSDTLGMVKFFLKKARLRKEWRGAAISPLTQAEFIYSQGKGELLSCHEISILSCHVKLREKLNRLEAALEILHALKNGYSTGHPAPLIYALSLRYLEALSSIADPSALSSSFRLKILNHEGLLSSEIDPFFSTDEWVLIEQLALNRSLSFFTDLVLPDYLHDKIGQFYQMQME